MNLHINNDLIIFKYITVRENKYLAKQHFKNTNLYKVSI